MCLLSDVEILEKISSKEIELVDPSGTAIIDPGSGKVTQKLEHDPLQAMGYDLSVGEVYRWGSADWTELKEGEDFILQPREFAAVKTYEHIRLSNSIAATVHSMARNTLLGLGSISTTIHPGWAKFEKTPKAIVVAVVNVSNAPLTLKLRQSFCRVMFYELSKPASNPAPTLNEVQDLFNKARYGLAKQYGLRSRILGWAWIVVATAAAAALLVLVSRYRPDYSTVAVAVVVALLSVLLAAIRRKYDIAPGL